jgi:hypothetical protein
MRLPCFPGRLSKMAGPDPFGWVTRLDVGAAVTDGTLSIPTCPLA